MKPRGNLSQSRKEFIGIYVAFFDLKLNPEESINLIDSINSPLRKKSFNQLFEVARGFPDIDADPKYRPNPPQSWDVEVSAESRVWKL